MQTAQDWVAATRQPVGIERPFALADDRSDD